MGRYAPVALEMQVLVSRTLNSGSAAGWSALDDMYARLPTLDFSRDLLEAEPNAFRVMRAPSCGWSDLGTPNRVAETLRRLPPQESRRVSSTSFINLAAQHALFESKGATG